VSALRTVYRYALDQDSLPITYSLDWGATPHPDFGSTVQVNSESTGHILTQVYMGLNYDGTGVPDCNRTNCSDGKINDPTDFHKSFPATGTVPLAKDKIVTDDVKAAVDKFNALPADQQDAQIKAGTA